MITKIYIVGPVGSGKSTLAKKLSETYNMPYFELDRVVYEPNLEIPNGNRKRTVSDRDEIFHTILNQDKWIIEDAGRLCFEEGLKQADSIILLEPKTYVRKFRILSRWIKQNSQLEPCNYIPDYAMLKCMFKWSDDYDSGKDNVKNRLVPYKYKLSILKNNKETNIYI